MEYINLHWTQGYIWLHRSVYSIISFVKEFSVNDYLLQQTRQNTTFLAIWPMAKSAYALRLWHCHDHQHHCHLCTVPLVIWLIPVISYVAYILAYLLYKCTLSNMCRWHIVEGILLLAHICQWQDKLTVQFHVCLLIYSVMLGL